MAKGDPDGSGGKEGEGERVVGGRGRRVSLEELEGGVDLGKDLVNRLKSGIIW